MRPLGRASVITYRDVGQLAREVVYATHLPFGPGSPAWGAASDVEGCWSPVLARCHHKSACKSNTLQSHAKYRVTASRTFLSQAGPQVGLELFKLSITFWLVVVELPSETKKATRRVALTCRWCVR
jgi:hypothetical protein